MPQVPFDRYIRYAELTEILQAFVAEYPDLVRLESIGKSYEGRNIWLVTVTEFATGDPLDKPAFWCDGNIHASEVSATTAVLKILYKLVTERPALLKDRVFYLVPRLGPDGAEWALEEVPRIIRSSTRPYPYDEEDIEGLDKQDVDGDGRILSMRVKDPNGPWKISEEEPRLMKLRDPGETGGDYYRVIPEGLFQAFDGMTMRPRKQKQGLDMNRNFPGGWRQENEQYGAGPYPTSEPEIRAAVQAIFDRPNICSAITFHTYSGVLLRPPSRFPDTDIPTEDLWAYQKLGAKGKEMTGYPDIAVYHDFRYHPKEVISGTFDDWMFDHRGVFAWTVEIWAPPKQAGITDYKFIDWFRDHPFEHDLQMLKWADEQLDGEGYIDWYPFEHPQLGSVEIGGWNALYAFRNPPPKFLDKEITPLAEWAIWHAGTGPCLKERAFESVNVGGNVRLRFAVQNTGWLPTSVTKQAASKKLCRGVIGEIYKLDENGDRMARPQPGEPEAAWLISGELRKDHGQLTGYSHTMVGGWGWSMDETTDVAVLEWIVAPGTYEIVAKHERAGTVRKIVTVD